MITSNIDGDFYHHIYKNFGDYLAVTFFLNRDEVPPEEPDLLRYILKEGRESEFIQFLLLNVHQLVFDENYQDDMRTAISLHMQKNIDEN
jgi:hypothetical protein